MAPNENPWPGPAPYDESTDRAFHGRLSEIRYLQSSIERSTLTVLYGNSGVGKTSILRAGIIPALRKTERYLPIYLRPSHFQKQTPVEVLRCALSKEADRLGVEVKMPEACGTLWELIQHRDFEIWNKHNRLLAPVLIFDQFEELLAISGKDEESPKWRATFFHQFCELVENRIPRSLSQRIERESVEECGWGARRASVPGQRGPNSDRNSCGAAEAEQGVFVETTATPSSATLEAIDRKSLGKQYYCDHVHGHIVISFKEEILPKVRRLRRHLPSIIENHYRVEDLTISAAVEAIEKPADFFSHEVALELANELSEPSGLIRLLNEIDAGKPNDEERLVPAGALSLICYLAYAEESSEGCQQRGGVDVDRLLDDHYDRVTRGMSKRLRAFIESRLVTKSGERIDIPRSTVEAGDAEIAELERAGVLRVERVGQEDWITVSHDRLAKAIARAGEARAKDRAKRRSVMAMAAGVVSAGALALGGSLMLYAADEKARESLSQLMAIVGSTVPQDISQAVRDRMLRARSQDDLNRAYNEARQLVYAQAAMSELNATAPQIAAAGPKSDDASASVETPYCSKDAAFTADQLSLLQILVLPTALRATQIGVNAPWSREVAYDLASACGGSTFYDSWSQLLKQDWERTCRKVATRCGQFPAPSASVQPDMNVEHKVN